MKGWENLIGCQKELMLEFGGLYERQRKAREPPYGCHWATKRGLRTSKGQACGHWSRRPSVERLFGIVEMCLDVFCWLGKMAIEVRKVFWVFKVGEEERS